MSFLSFKNQLFASLAFGRLGREHGALFVSTRFEVSDKILKLLLIQTVDQAG